MSICIHGNHKISTEASSPAVNAACPKYEPVPIKRSAIFFCQRNKGFAVSSEPSSIVDRIHTAQVNDFTNVAYVCSTTPPLKTEITRSMVSCVQETLE
jgi:hypothetical protein